MPVVLTNVYSFDNDCFIEELFSRMETVRIVYVYYALALALALALVLVLTSRSSSTGTNRIRRSDEEQ